MRRADIYRSAGLAVAFVQTRRHTAWVIKSSPEPARFAIFDVVESNLPEEANGSGIVTEVRRHEDGTYRYGIAPVDRDGDVGGIYGERQLTGTGHRVAVEFFWSGSVRAREIVRIADSHPKPRWRGCWATVADEVAPDECYTLEIPQLRKQKMGVKWFYRDVAVADLLRTGDRMPPAPIPRPMTTWTHGEDGSILKPWYEYDLLDELDQYL